MARPEKPKEPAAAGAKEKKARRHAAPPFDRPKGKVVQVGFADVVKVLAMIEKHGRSKQLVARTKDIEALARLPAEAVIAVKEIVAANPAMRSSALGRRVLYARRAAEVTMTLESVVPGRGQVRSGDCCGIGKGD